MRKDFQFGLIVGTLISVVLLLFYFFSDNRSPGNEPGAASASSQEQTVVTPLRTREQGHLPESRQDLLERLEQLRQRPSNESKPVQSEQSQQLQQSGGQDGDSGEGEKPQTKQPQKYTVVSGDTLSAISKRFYGTSTKWQVILDANRGTLKNPAGLKPGMELIIPPQ